jgi:ribonuclease HI
MERKAGGRMIDKTIHAYFDGAVEPKNPGGHGSWAFTVRHDAGTTVGIPGYCGSGPHITNNVMEYRAFLELLRCLEVLAPSHVVIRGDSKLVVEQMNGRWGCRGGLYAPLYGEALLLLARVRKTHLSIRVEWVRREENEEADRLAGEELSKRGIRIRTHRRAA